VSYEEHDRADFDDFRERRIRMIARWTAIRSDMGQSFVELALVLPIFILLIVGAAELGRLAYASIEVSNAARAGVAYGAQNHITASDNAGIQLAATKDALNVTSLVATATQSCSCSDGTAITCANAATNCVSPARIIEFVQVNTVAAVNTGFRYPGFGSSFTLRGQAIMRVQQ
jgi:Flp pilus assembly protein TadG